MTPTILVSIMYAIYICNAQQWLVNYRKEFFKKDPERQTLIQMDEKINNWTDNKLGVMFSGVFTNHSVLQREPQYASIYGTCDTPNTEIILMIKNENKRLEDESFTTISMDNGDWKITFPHTYKNGGNYTLSVLCADCVSEPRSVELYNITFGDVYLCLGQSNMVLELEFTFNGHNTLSNITHLDKYSNIRFYNKRKTEASDGMFVIPREDELIDGKYQWHLGSNIERVNRFSAVCWYTAQSLVDMYDMTDINFGMIVSAMGGSQIESWIQNNTIESSDCADTNHDCPGSRCGNLYNGMLMPFVNMSIKGILWYQGENNVKQQMGNYSHESPYACLEKLMVEQYRNLWNDTYLPFGIFQLAPAGSEGFGEAMPYFRHAQTFNYGILPNEEMPNVFMSQAYDIGDPWRHYYERTNDGIYPIPYDWNTTKWYMGAIHPRPKLYLGQRMAMNLNKFVYNNDAIFSGPLLKGCELNIYDQMITINFNENILYDEKIIIQPLSLWYNESLVNTVNYWSAIKLLINHNWIDLNGMNVFSVDNNGHTMHIDISNVLGNGREVVEGISYAWSEYPCCGDLDQTQHPCPMNMCPIITDKSRLPAIPFQAAIVDNKCQCFHPQTCDGSSYMIPGTTTTTTQPTTTIMPTPEPTGRPSRSPTIDTWIFNECNVMITKEHLLSSNNVVVYFKFSHAREGIVSKPFVTFFVNDIEIKTTHNRFEYVHLSDDEINSAIKNNKFEAKLSFEDDHGYRINYQRIKCDYLTQPPTVEIITDKPTDYPSKQDLITMKPTNAPSVNVLFGNDGNNNQVKEREQVKINIEFNDPFTVFSVFMLCLLVNIGVYGCYYYKKRM